MSVFFLILIAVFLVDVAWAIAAVRILRRVPGRGWWLAASLLFVGAQAGGLGCILFSRAWRTHWDRSLPHAAISSILLWHLFGLGFLILAAAAGLIWVVAALIRGLTGRARRPAAPVGPGGSALPPTPALSRRQFLGLAALATPPAFNVLVTGIAAAQLRHFRVRRFLIPIEGLPRDLDGATLAQVSDLHLGRLTSAGVLRAAANTVNDLRPDLVLLTGDLINDELADLTEGLAVAESMEGRYGRCLIEGNHDLFESRSEFERRARGSAVPLLLNGSLHLEVRGHPVQLLGIRWDQARMEDRDEIIARSVREVVALREPEAFPILLAHHPHAFDPAAAAGLPLTFSGHTHGGQIMLTDHLGFGPMFYRYWSGHYRLGRSQMIVSNGVGNWFPLRTHAPAEIVHATLRRV